MKYCYKCKKTKNKKEFGKHKGKKDGLQPLCKGCVKKYRESNKERFSLYDRKKYEKHGDKIRKRQRQSRKNDPKKFQIRDRKYREANTDYLKEYDAGRARKLKIEVFSNYGDSCACCEESYLEFLTIDHTEGGGTTHRKQVGYGQKFYKWLKDNNYPKEGYRILCMNCNLSLGLRGYCPHKEGTKYKGIRED